MSVAPESVDLLTASLSAALVKNDDQGNTRLEKRSTHNLARDDVAAALVLASHVVPLSVVVVAQRQECGITGLRGNGPG